MTTLKPSEQHRAADLAREAIASPRAAERLAAKLVAMEAVFRDAKRNRYLMAAPTVRPIINRATLIMEADQ
jgi:hypothetical protein